MHSSYAHIHMNYKSSLERGLQTFIVLDIHPHKNLTTYLEFFLFLAVLAASIPNNLYATLNELICKLILHISLALDTILSKH